MKPLYQHPDEPECGAICLAMLANITVVKAKTVLYGDGNAKRVGRKALISALSDFDRFPKTSRSVIISSINMIINVRSDALVYARSQPTDEDGETYEGHHWAVWDGKANTLRDPLGFTIPLRLTSYTEIL